MLSPPRRRSFQTHFTTFLPLLLAVCGCGLLWRGVDALKAIAVDNGIVDGPRLQCGPGYVTVNFTTQSEFLGRLYVKGLARESQCQAAGNGHDRSIALNVSFDSPCQLRRHRSLNPRAILVTTTVVISFHPFFVTEVDRAYRLQCVYREANETVNARLRVHPLTSASPLEQPPLPVCRYEIREGGPAGRLLNFATVGTKIYHQWICDTQVENTFCAVVHSCVADDGHGRTVNILDKRGCSIDQVLLADLEYPTDLSAGQEARLFKYPDNALIYFQCQVAITRKQEGRECARPVCHRSPSIGEMPKAVGKSNDGMENAGSMLRKRRDVSEEGTVDVSVELQAVELFDQSDAMDVDSTADKVGCFSAVTLFILLTIAIFLSPFLVRLCK